MSETEAGAAGRRSAVTAEEAVGPHWCGNRVGQEAARRWSATEAAVVACSAEAAEEAAAPTSVRGEWPPRSALAAKAVLAGATTAAGVAARWARTRVPARRALCLAGAVVRANAEHWGRPRRARSAMGHRVRARWVAGSRAPWPPGYRRCSSLRPHRTPRGPDRDRRRRRSLRPCRRSSGPRTVGADQVAGRRPRLARRRGRLRAAGADQNCRGYAPTAGAAAACWCANPGEAAGGCPTVARAVWATPTASLCGARRGRRGCRIRPGRTRRHSLSCVAFVMVDLKAGNGARR